MRKLLAIMVLMFLGLSSTHAKAAVPPTDLTSLAFVGATGSVLPMMMAVAGGVGIEVMIVEGVDPWTPNFSSVSYEYPTAHHRTGN